MMSVAPLPATIIPPRTSANFGTSVEWRSGLDCMLDYIMIAPAWSCQGPTAGQAPATVATDDNPMMARLTYEAVERGPAGEARGRSG